MFTHCVAIDTENWAKVRTKVETMTCYHEIQLNVLFNSHLLKKLLIFMTHSWPIQEQKSRTWTQKLTYFHNYFILHAYSCLLLSVTKLFSLCPNQMKYGSYLYSSWYKRMWFYFYFFIAKIEPTKPFKGSMLSIINEWTTWEIQNFPTIIIISYMYLWLSFIINSNKKREKKKHIFYPCVLVIIIIVIIIPLHLHFTVILES